MDFQHLLEQAAKNQEVAEKKLTETKRYSTKVPPAKKTARPAVDPAAIRARIEQKEREKQQKAQEEERERKEAFRRQLEADKKKQKDRKSKKPSSSPTKAAVKTTRNHQDESHEKLGAKREVEQSARAHKAFLKKVERDANRARALEERRDAYTEQPKPKPKKKPAPTPKKPMSFKELMDIAEQQKKGGVARTSNGKDNHDVSSSDEEEEEQVYKHAREGKDQNRDDKHKEQILKQRKGEKHVGGAERSHANQGSTKGGKPFTHGHRTKGTPSDQMKGPFISSDRARGKHEEAGRSERVGSASTQSRTNNDSFVKERNSLKGESRNQKHHPQAEGRSHSQNQGSERSVASSKVRSKIDKKSSGAAACNVSDKSDNRPLVKARDVGRQKTDDRPRPRQGMKSAEGSANRVPARPDDRPEKKAGDSARDKAQDGRTKPRPKDVGQMGPPSRHLGHDRDRLRVSGAAPSRSLDVPRKRPAPSQGPIRMTVKQGRLLSSDSEESDYDDGDGFIDDTPLEEMECSNVSHYIKEIFGYDKSKYGYESDYALRSMDASFRDVQKEEARSSRLGMLEDLEDMRKEREENMRKAQMKKKKKR